MGCSISDGACDLVVIGAGPAGACAARHAALAGLDVLLLDSATSPRDKPCGEGILPGGVRLLRSWGLLDEIREAGARPFRSIDFHFSKIPRAPRVSLPMGEGDADLGIALSRIRLDAILLEAARRAGARIRLGVRAGTPREEGETISLDLEPAEGAARIRAKFAIVATGRPGGATRPTRFGISAHLADRGPADRVDVFLRDGFEIYTSAVEAGSRIVSILCDAHVGEPGGDLASRTRRLVAAPDLPAWLRIEPDRILSAPLPTDRLRIEPVWSMDSPRILSAGNALVATDPIAAQGLLLALATGFAAAESAAWALRENRVDDAPARYAREAGPVVRRAREISAGLLLAVRRPRIGRWILRQIEDEGPAGTLLAEATGISIPRASTRRFFALARTCLGSLRTRARGLEILDEIDPRAVPASTWRFLARINRLGGGDRSSAREIRALLPAQTGWVVDLGAGDGAMIDRMIRRAPSFARHRWIALDRAPPSRGLAVAGDLRRLPFRTGSICVAHASLAFHHLADEDVPRALSEARRVATRGVVVNDLVRTLPAWLATVILTILGGDAFVRHDGPLSIRKAFRMSEIEAWRAHLDGWRAKIRRIAFFRFTFVARPVSSDR